MNTTTLDKPASAIAPRAQQFDLSPQTFEQALTFAKYLADSDLVPKDFRGRPGNCLIAIQWGYELGLKAIQAIQNIAVINGRPALWGDSVIAIVRASPVCEYVLETDDGNAATCRVKRRGEPEQVRTFSMEDAQKAGLSGKQGPWTQYPKRMRQMRARAFALRDVFPDVLRGIPIAEELMDTPTEKFMGAADEVRPPAGPTHYPADDFAANFEKWAKHIATGRKTFDGIVAMVETKGKLTDEQKRQLSDAVAALAPPVEDVKPKGEQGNGAPTITYAEVASRLHAATNTDELAEAGSLVSAVEDQQQREELNALYDQRANDLF